MSFKGERNIPELKAIANSHAAKSPGQIFVQRELHPAMDAKKVLVRECLASDNYPNPLPFSINLDTSGSMGIVPLNLIQGELPRMFVRVTEMGSVGSDDVQLCINGVADYTDTAPIQLGQFEGDNRVFDGLTRILLEGGSGSERYHEAYGLALYALVKKTKCDIWKQGRKGHAFIVGDEMRAPTLSAHNIKKIFGDTQMVPGDLSVRELIKLAETHWNLSFLFVATDFYGEAETKRIWKHWQDLLGPRAVRLDAKATGLPEIVSAIVGVDEGHFDRFDVPSILSGIGVEDEILFAVTTALGLSKERHPLPVPGERRRRRGPTPV